MAESSGKADKSILDEARARFKLAVDAEADIRKEAIDDIRFRVGDGQWPDDIKRQRAGRPCPISGRMDAFVTQVVNEQKRARPAICVSPVAGGANYKTAEVIEGMIRHIERISRARIAYDTAFEQAVSSSFGHFRINTGYTAEDSMDQEILIQSIPNQFTVYTDPDYQQPDASDAKWRFVTEKIKRDVFKAKYGFEPTAVSDAAQGDDDADWWDEDDVRIAEYWRKTEKEIERHMLSDGSMYDGPLTPGQLVEYAQVGIQVIKSKTGCETKIEQFLMTGDRIIKKSEWLGKYIPIVTVVGKEMIIDGKRRLLSLFRLAKDSARMDNYWAATEAEVLALQPKAPWIAPEGTFDGHEEAWASANTANIPYLEYNPVSGAAPQRQFYSGNDGSGLRNARMAAQEDMKATVGLYDASLGARSNEVTGVAIRERSKQGDNATFHFTAAMATAIEAAGRIIVDLIPKVYDTARTTRIIKPDEQAEMVAINSLFVDPKTGQQSEINLAKGQYDVTVKVGPSFESQREEARQAMIEFLNANPQAAPVVGDLVATNMDWPEADKFAERLKNMIPPQALGKPPQPDPMMQLAQETEKAKAQQIQMKGQIDLQMKQMDLQMKQFESRLQAQTAQETGEDRKFQMQLRQMELQLKHQELQLQALTHQKEMNGTNTNSDQVKLIIAELQEETKRMVAAGKIMLDLNTGVPVDMAGPTLPPTLN